MTLGTIAAVVVTFNRCALLERVLESLARQTRIPDCVIVVDNASEDDTAHMLALVAQSYPVPLRVLRMERNLGGAGGFHRGVRDAYVNGHDAVWLMDDDTLPQAEALEFLERDLQQFETAHRQQPGFICSTVLWRDGQFCVMNVPQPARDWCRFLPGQLPVVLIESCSFVSVLIPRAKIAQAGYPIPEFFIWYDDVEYTSRISALGHSGLLSMRSTVVHEIADNAGVDFSRIPESAVWKHAYGLRNQAAVLRWRRGWVHYLAFAIGRARIVLRQRLGWSAKRKLLWSLVAAAAFHPKVELPK